jgi:hypothetical protein
MIHKDNRDMSSIFDDRERREFSMHLEKTNNLVESKKIPAEMQLRSLRSQGPLVNEHKFRDLESAQALQPPLRFRSVTDKERFVENHMP